MSFPRHPEIYPPMEAQTNAVGAPAHRLDEFPTGYSLTGCSPAWPASASPVEQQYALQSSCRSRNFQRTANSVLTVCVSRGGKRREAPSDLHAEEYFDEGIKGLEYVIEHSGKVSEYPYHVLGSQGLAWVHRSGWNREDKRELLQRLAQTVEEGCRYHEKAENLVQLREDLKKEILLTVVSSASSGAKS